MLSFDAGAQQLVAPAPRWTTQPWDARWITAPQGPVPGVFHFRKAFTLWEKPAQFIIHISADNRYRLFVNGKYIHDGPQLGDARHWRFDSFDLTTLMQSGANVIAVQVWDLGKAAPLQQMGKQLGLIVQGDNQVAAVVNTDKTWKCYQNTGLEPIEYKPVDPSLYFQYYAAGPTDKIDGKKIPWDWEKPGFNDSKWPVATELQAGAPFQSAGFGDAVRELLPRSIPVMERTYQSFKAIRRTEGINASSANSGTPITIPPKQKAVILFDQGQLTTAFPEWVFSKGQGREVKVTYAEAVFDDIHKVGHRDSIRGKSIHGVYDLIYLDGGENKTYSTLSYRAFRYVQVEVSAGDTPLVIEKFGSWFTGYPFRKVASFTSSDAALGPVFDIGWHTARLCAHETYMDCPYWERLQYIGDTRIQALVSYYVSDDDRLARNAIEQFEWSLQYDGLTYSRYPSSQPQYIPNYSLVWVAMVYDYFLYRHDQKFVEARMPGVRNVLEHFQRYITPDKLLSLQPYWDFLDHSYSSKRISDESENKGLTANSLFYVYVLDMASQMENTLGNTRQAEEYAQLSKEIKEAVRARCWDAPRGLYADSPDKKHYSMHSNILAILCDLVPANEQKDMIKILLNNNSLTKTTLYFDFYLGRAMNKAGAGDLYHQLLTRWKDLLSQGFTTFPEGVDRSDCHAWSASPDFEMLSTFCGVSPDAPGFEKVLVQPQLEDGEKAKGVVSHWAGKIEIDLTRVKNELRGRVVLPPGITGRLIWNEKEMVLKSGGQAVSIKPLIEQIIKKKN